jgi:hypothetical protein
VVFVHSHHIGVRTGAARGWRIGACLDTQLWMGKVCILYCSAIVVFCLYLVKIVQTLTN